MHKKYWNRRGKFSYKYYNNLAIHEKTHLENNIYYWLTHDCIQPS